MGTVSVCMWWTVGNLVNRRCNFWAIEQLPWRMSLNCSNYGRFYELFFTFMWPNFTYHQTSDILSALLQLHLHSRLNTWLQWIGQRHARWETCTSWNLVGLTLEVWQYVVLFQNVIDGDLCEMFNSMDAAKQKTVAEELDRTSSEVSKKLEDIRTRYAFWIFSYLYLNMYILYYSMNYVGAMSVSMLMG